MRARTVTPGRKRGGPGAPWRHSHPGGPAKPSHQLDPHTTTPFPTSPAPPGPSPARRGPPPPAATLSTTHTTPRTFVGALDAGPGAGSPRFAVAVARFNDLVTRPLLAGALDGFARHGAGGEAVDVSFA